MTKLAAALLLGACGLLYLDTLHAESGTPKPTAVLGDKITVVKTESGDFPTAGLLHLKNAVGLVTVTGWDQPGYEMTTIKSTKTAVEDKDRDAANKMIESVKISTGHKGEEVTVSTEFPKHSKIARPFLGMTDFDLEYRIHVPRAARLDIEDVMGEINLENLSGDLRASAGLGQINVRVPEGSYAIDAKCKTGVVNSDFPGIDLQRHWWIVKWPGQTFMASAASTSQKMFLRVSYGDIVILKMH